MDHSSDHDNKTSSDDNMILSSESEWTNGGNDNTTSSLSPLPERTDDQSSTFTDIRWPFPPMNISPFSTPYPMNINPFPMNINPFYTPYPMNINNPFPMNINPSYTPYPMNINPSSYTPYPTNINPSAPFVSNPEKEKESREEKAINLREWLETEGMSKADLVGMFRKIVMLVDGLHQQGMVMLDLRPSMFALKGDEVKYLGRVTRNNARKRGFGEEGTSSCEFAAVNDENNTEKKPKVTDHMEKKWYAFPEGFENNDSVYFNVYCLGLLLFEFLSHFERIEEYNEAMMYLHKRNLPLGFFSGTHKEAQSCSWLLLPEPSSYPTTREILESKWLCELESTISSTDENSSNATPEEAGIDLLLNFLVLSKQRHENEGLKLSEQIKLLDADIELARKAFALEKYLGTENKDIPESSTSRKNVLRGKLKENLIQLETNYFSMSSNETTTPGTGRTDTDVLKCRESWSRPQTQPDPPKPANRVEALYAAICNLARGNKFELCGMLKKGDMLNTNYDTICSLCFDRDEEYFAAAGTAKKIKIFEIRSFLDDEVDIQYPVVEMSNESKLRCISWNSYITNHLVSSDYDGLVKMWDTNTGQSFARYTEHQKRACSVDFSRVDPGKFASGGDDGSVRLWNINERNSVGVIWNRASVCSVQFSGQSSHILAYGSTDKKTYVYDLRHTRSPWCTLGGHEETVTYVSFLDSDTIVSASIDSTLKLWDLSKTSLQDISSDACGLTFSGHTNQKNFVGMAVMDGYIASGSETNEVYAYYKSLPLPIAIHKLDCFDCTYDDDEITDWTQHTISSLCWRKKSQMLVAGNSRGNINILRMV